MHSTKSEPIWCVSVSLSGVINVPPDGDVDNGEGNAYVDAGGKWEIFVSSAQYFCESKTTLKITFKNHLHSLTSLSWIILEFKKSFFKSLWL